MAVKASELGLPLHIVTVMVVDDRRIARRLAARILSEEGFRVLEADGMSEALEVLSQARGRVDLVMLDVVLADGDGVKLSQEILAEWPDQRLLFMSGYAAEMMSRYGLENLEVPFLAKPFTRSELLAKVADGLRQPIIPQPRAPVLTDRRSRRR
jgi:two-component system cell cycle sensor histidine kinase/response regulator CckA